MSLENPKPSFPVSGWQAAAFAVGYLVLDILQHKYECVEKINSFIDNTLSAGVGDIIRNQGEICLVAA